MKVNKLEKTTLIHISQQNIDKQNLEKNAEDVDKKKTAGSSLVTKTVLNTKIREINSKIPGLSGLVKKVDYMTLKYQKSRENTLQLLIITNLQVTYLMQS